MEMALWRRRAVSLPKLIVLVALLGGGAGLIYEWRAPPSLSAQALAGKAPFDANCAACHGAAGVGTDRGPPLVHQIYNPGHHPDAAFFSAAHNGVRHHHWHFGDMPPQPQVTDADLAAIVAYVRGLQEAAGIVYQEHRM